MKRLAACLGLIFTTAILPSSLQAQTRGGSLTFARQSDCLYLDPVHIEINADIWMALNLYDMLIAPTLDGKGLKPDLATSYKLADVGMSVSLKMRPARPRLPIRSSSISSTQIRRSCRRWPRSMRPSSRRNCC